MGLLQDMCWEFDKWAVKLDDLSMEEFAAKLADIEDAMPEREGKIQNQGGRNNQKENSTPAKTDNGNNTSA